MKIKEKTYRTVWLHPVNPEWVQIIDQRFLPHQFVIETLREPEDFAIAIKDMHVRGAPLIGATAALGMYSACLKISGGFREPAYLYEAADLLLKTRPTAVNLEYGITKVRKALEDLPAGEWAGAAKATALEIIEESVDQCRHIGEAGLPFLRTIASRKKGKPVNILTHCNAGWLACIDYGTATAPIYLAQEAGIPVHVWVDETRPRNQGARLTAFELGQQGIQHTVITDNAGGHLMQRGLVDVVIVGTDRTTRQGDVANKIGTYLKALAAHDNGIPFYVAAPSSSIDWRVNDGLREIPIEERGGEEVQYIQGWDGTDLRQVLLTPEDSPVANYAFDLTPSRLVTGLITERGICEASEDGLLKLFPEWDGMMV